jgi:beta-lactamase class D
VQPAGRVRSASGERRFGETWPEGTVVAAKTGRSTDATGRHVLRLVGHVGRGKRSWVFVSCVIGAEEPDANEAIDLAARSLHEEHVI